VTVVLKLGGSVVTRKGEPETVDEEALDRAVRAVAAVAPDDLVLVHGGGSFGHPAAEHHGVSRSDGTHDAVAVCDVHRAMVRLSEAVVTRLHGAGVRALPVRPLSAGARDAAGDLSLWPGSVETMLAAGFTPVLHGDVVADVDRGATVVSGDELVAALSADLSAERVGLCSAVPGVLDDAGEVVPRIERFEQVADVLGGSESTDVTGGMAAKVRTLLELGVPASIFGLDELGAFLSGETPGTLVEA